METIDAAFASATALTQAGRTDEAEAALVALLARAPNHFPTITSLATLVHGRGAIDVAVALSLKAVAEHPHEPLGYINLGTLYAQAGDFASAESQFRAALAIDPAFSLAHFGLAQLFAARGDDDEAMRHRQLALPRTIIDVRECITPGVTPIDVLVLASANGGNLRTEPLMDFREVRQYTLVVESYDAAMTLPDHHLVFNIVGDADRGTGALERAAQIITRTTKPVLNPPDRVVLTERAAVMERLAQLPNVRTPLTKSFVRSALTADALAAAGFTYPVLIRTPGYHTGQHFSSAAAPEDVAATCAALPGDQLLAIGFLDGRNGDSWFRKYRMLFIGGRLYPLHLAISQHWKVHYFSADMLAPDHQLEEAAYLNDPRAELGEKAYAALEAIEKTLGLDYGGIDFATDAEGNVLVFEANATMGIFPVQEAYRRPAVKAAAEAFHAVVRTRAAREHAI